MVKPGKEGCLLPQLSGLNPALPAMRLNRPTLERLGETGPPRLVGLRESGTAAAPMALYVVRFDVVS